MTIEEIQAELNKMPAALSAAGWEQPEAQLMINANSRMTAHLRSWRDTATYHFANGDTPAECIAKAWAYIKALPDPEQAILTTYSRKLADAIDYGHENNVPAKLVDPVRRAQKAVSDALLPAPSAA
jgi:hypothetical protein